MALRTEKILIKKGHSDYSKYKSVNGALNIMRKVIGDGFLGNLINSGCVFQPIRVNLV